ncbi:ABC transporter ATP-binding protein [Mycolicibacterium thermoresistibile]
MTGHDLIAGNLTVAFDGHRVLDDVSVTLRTGELFGITGPSGCGKTTLLRVLAGLHRPESGWVRYDGAPAPPPGSVALLAQHPRLVCNPRWPLGRIIAEPAAIRGDRIAVGAVAARVGLEPDLLDRYPAQVSDGQLQRACLGRVLVQRPRYLLCDEPTAMLDPIATADVVTLLDALAGATAVAVVSHDDTVITALSRHTLAMPGL